MRSRFYSSSFAFIAISLFALSSGVPFVADGKQAGSALAKEAPTEQQNVYHKVWELVGKNFYDPTFGDQDWSRWEHRYDGKIKDDADEQKAIDSMLLSLGDRFTRYLNKTAFEEETTAIAGRLFGIGVQIAQDRTGKLLVIAPLEGSPAAEAGLLPGDEISEIDGKPTMGEELPAASKRIRGAIDTQVTLTIVRKGETKKITVTRGEVKLKSVQTVKMLNKDIGYIRLSTFMSNTAGHEVQDALVTLTPARGIILDLRENPGGLVTNALEICSMFIPQGVVVSTVDRNSKPVDSRVNGRLISNQPLVVLIDQGTASAAEITSGALRDTGRAMLVGPKRSFGKGLVQSVIRLEDGSGVNITIARYLTPNGTDINKKGIVPDYIVELEKADYEKKLGPWWHYEGEKVPSPTLLKPKTSN
ncbi:MAG: S41 family peptidase [Candidatus Obscuribacterales bacterium]|nr:S41 family peptidase [Candidatus Obscuribacterales bacterium]